MSLVDKHHSEKTLYYGNTSNAAGHAGQAKKEQEVSKTKAISKQTGAINQLEAKNKKIILPEKSADRKTEETDIKVKDVQSKSKPAKEEKASSSNNEAAAKQNELENELMKGFDEFDDFVEEANKLLKDE